MKNFFFINLILLLQINSTTASHIIGGEITYECISTSDTTRTYEVMLNIYRDCFSTSSFDLVAHLSVYKYLQNEYLEISNHSSLIQNIIEIPYVQSECFEVTETCFEKGNYSFNITLEISSNESYFFVYQRCCRNELASNVLDLNNVGSTYFIEVTPSAQETCNSSPVFEFSPPPVVCIGEDINFNNESSDLDGDDVVYSFCSPSVASNIISPNPAEPPPYQDVQFISPLYSAENPLGSLSIDSLTGEIYGEMNISGNFIVGICISDYRNGILMSKVKRDFQFNTSTCSQKVKADIMTDIYFDSIAVIKSCDDLIIKIKNESYNIDFINNLKWIFLIDGENIEYTEWNALIEFPRSGIYRGFLKLNENSYCSDSIAIKVIVSDIIASFSHSPINLSNKVPDANFYNMSKGADSWKWYVDEEIFSVEKNPSYIFSDTGQYLIKLIAENEYGCKDTVTNIVYVSQKPDLYYPNVFSPNNDGINDSFKGFGKTYGINDFKISIWNRWGSLVYLSKDIYTGWNGRLQNIGDKLQNGMYVYIVEILDSDNIRTVIKGDVLLIE